MNLAERRAKKAEYMRKYMRKQRKLYPEKVRAWENKWDLAHPERVREAARLRMAKWTKSNPEKYSRIQKKSRQRNALHCQARTAVRNALAAKNITKPEKCQSCGRECKPQAHHHRGYARKYWLDVLWLCKCCHCKSHKN
jgi:hypothetical protein